LTKTVYRTLKDALRAGQELWSLLQEKDVIEERIASPTFKPVALVDFEKSGFQRKNRVGAVCPKCSNWSATAACTTCGRR
jgi:hypothetical protein